MYLSLVSSYISMGFTPTWLQILPNPQPSDSAYKEARDEAQVISTPRNNEGFSQTYKRSTYSCIDRVRVKKKKVINITSILPFYKPCDKQTLSQIST